LNHKIGLDTFHYKWSRSHRPVVSIEDGDTVNFKINDVASWHFDKDSTSKDVARLDARKLYPLSGPVFIEGAEPGDALVVETVDVKVADFGWSAIIPGLGLLGEDFKRPYLYKWDLEDKRTIPFERGIEIPARPFCGVMGVAPPERGEVDPMPPGKHDGNLDIRHLTAGSKLKLPVWVDGALFSAGDVHAAMGDGEVCVCAIECAGEATLRFTLERGTRLRWPQFSSTGEPVPKKGFYTATGIAPDLMIAAREAVRNMLDHLTSGYGLTREQAYVLCSVAADIRVHEVVDQPNWVVGAMISRDILPG
jgi:acetamidase/formamidase